ncbi:MAG: Inhibitor of g-type lysozyme precursor [Acidobacteria bacterium OLB17]|nr:MAG: Inhibitor of g-type lysozyme precursor [Acidobacteria bacterium OLB17]MCZ2389637.1 Ig-like domain-containing protein [Acidobacteriota bacterium]
MYERIFCVLFSAVLTGAFALSASAQKDITSVDLRNFSYRPSCLYEDSGQGKAITVKDGEYSYEKQEDGYTDRFYFNIFDVVYGDLTGDGRPEAVALSVCNTGGTGNFTEGFIFTLRNGKAVQIGVLPGGDRAYGGIRKAWIENDELWVETNDPGENGGACCPVQIITSRYRLRAGKLVESGKHTTRQIFPKREVKFAKGKSSATITLTVRGDEGAELTLRAAKGQTMTVTVSDKAVDATLLGEAKVTTTDNGFSAVLDSSGSYSIQLANDAAEDKTITVTISIR